MSIIHEIISFVASGGSLDEAVGTLLERQFFRELGAHGTQQASSRTIMRALRGDHGFEDRVKGAVGGAAQKLSKLNKIGGIRPRRLASGKIEPLRATLARKREAKEKLRGVLGIAGSLRQSRSGAASHVGTLVNKSGRRTLTNVFTDRTVG